LLFRLRPYNDFPFGLRVVSLLRENALTGIRLSLRVERHAFPFGLRSTLLFEQISAPFGARRFDSCCGRFPKKYLNTSLYLFYKRGLNMKLFHHSKKAHKKKELMNHTLKILILSDIFVFSGLGLIGPILSIFINDNLVDGSIFAAGLASTIYLITQAILQIVFSYKFNPKDRLWMLKVGTAIMALVPFGYIFATSVYHLYIIEFIWGVGAAFAYPSWSSLFTANLEKGKRGLQYSIYSSSVGIGTAITAGVGGLIAELIGFEWVFIITGAIAIIGLLFLFRLNKSILKKT
jgi:hypothetical protein